MKGWSSLIDTGWTQLEGGEKSSSLLQVDPVQQVSTRSWLPPSALSLLGIPRSFPISINCIILTLRESIPRASVMGNHCAEDSWAVIGGDGADYDSICSRRLIIGIRSWLKDWKLKVGLLRVLELELFVV